MLLSCFDNFERVLNSFLSKSFWSSH